MDLKLQRLPNDVGIPPSRLLFDRSKLTAEVRFQIEFEIVPWKLFKPRLRN
jgi:hypothetical protein